MNHFSEAEIKRVRESHPLEVYLPARGFELKRVGQELACRCMFHEDNTPSFSVNPAKQLWTCRAGCGGGDILAFVQKLDGLGFSETVEKLGGQSETITEQRIPLTRAIAATPSNPAVHPPSNGVKPTIVATYSYTDAAGSELFQAVRLSPKSFRQRRRGPDNKWLWNLEGIEPVLYRLPDVLESEFVWIVEGEKDADNIAAFGLCATCNPMGAGKWRDWHTEAMRGKIVVLCGDNDEPGQKHMDAVERAIAPVAKSTRRLRIPAPHKDVSDYLAAATTPEAGMKELLDIAESVPELFNGVDLPLQSMAELETDYRAFVKASDKRSLHFSLWLPRLGALRPVLPGELVFILANTGAGKTAALQNIAASIPHLPTLLFELELPGTLTFERFAALASGEDAKDVWRAYKEENTVCWRESRKLDHVHVCSKSGIKVSEIEKIVTLAHLKTGKPPAVVMVDYIGLVHGEGRSKYERTSAIAQELKVLAKRTNTIVICSSQVSRDKDDPFAEITLFSGKDSGEIENSSGVLFGLWRDKENPERSYLRVLKSTKGGGGLLVHLDFIGAAMQMRQSAEQPEVSHSAPKLKPVKPRSTQSIPFPYQEETTP